MIASHKSRPARRGGFTLVEMLTVIVIIGILSGLVVGGAISAIKAARRATILAEIGQLKISLENYKTEIGEYPPDFAFCDLPLGNALGDAARSRVLIHMRKRFPRLRLADWADFQTKCGLTAGPGATELNPSTALVFWLGGPLDSSGKPSGFSEDPSNPFKSGEPRGRVYYDFDPARMLDASGSPTLQLQQPRIQPVSPYVYFCAIKDNSTGTFEYGRIAGTTFTPFSYDTTSSGVCVPYLENVLGASASATPDASTDQRVWRAPQKYQVIGAGLDGKFSTGTAPDFRFSKLGEGLTDADYDNLTSFAEGELQKEL